MPDVTYYSKPEKQSLNDKICNEIQVSFAEEERLMTPAEVTQNINDRLGDTYSVEDVEREIGKLGSSVRMWKEFLVITEMISSTTTDYRAHLSNSKKWNKKYGGNK